MLKLAALASLVSLLFINACANAEAQSSHENRRGCAVATAPITESIITPIVVEPVAIAPVAVKPIVKPRPTVKAPITGQSMTLEVSGYTSEVGQTDDRPCEAADQSDICKRKAGGELICASNVFALGTKIYVDGLGPCVVADRMNSRYKAHVDWYFADKRLALKIGRKNRTVTVLR